MYTRGPFTMGPSYNETSFFLQVWRLLSLCPMRSARGQGSEMGEALPPNLYHLSKEVHLGFLCDTCGNYFLSLQASLQQNLPWKA